VGCCEAEARSVETAELDVPRRDIEPGTTVIALRTAIVAKVADVYGGVRVWSAAADAVLRIRSVLKTGSALPWIIESESQRARTPVGELREDGIVGVDGERCRGRECSYCRAPPLRDDLKLSVAVELVAKEIPERHDARACPNESLREGTLVHFEQAELRTTRGNERRRDAGQQICACPIPRQARIRSENLRRHGCCRRLPVRRRNDDDTLRQARRKGIDGARIELPEHLAGKCRAASTPDGPRQRADSARADSLECESYAHPASVPRGEEETLLWDTCRIRRTL
jgi:hypothetical protein